MAEKKQFDGPAPAGAPLIDSGGGICKAFGGGRLKTGGCPKFKDAWKNRRRF
jgi:hypothetical protein